MKFLSFILFVFGGSSLILGIVSFLCNLNFDLVIDLLINRPQVFIFWGFVSIIFGTGLYRIIGE